MSERAWGAVRPSLAGSMAAQAAGTGVCRAVPWALLEHHAFVPSVGSEVLLEKSGMLCFLQVCILGLCRIGARMLQLHD